MTEAQKRLSEAIIYVAGKGSALDPAFGMTKIYKALVFADIACLRTLGQTITRWRYLHLPNGPVPVRGHKIIENLEQSGAVSKMAIPLSNGKELHRIVVHREHLSDLFSDEELSLLDFGLSLACQGTADDVSDLSHMLPLWRWSEPNKPIDDELLALPYLVTDAQPTGGDLLDFAHASAKEQGLL